MWNILLSALCLCGGASATEQAVRLTPPPPPTTIPADPATWARCPQWEQTAETFGLPERFDYLSWRESRCDPMARNSCCTGLVQIHRTWVPQLAHCGVYHRDDLHDPVKNYCAARYILDVQGWGAWAITN